MNISRMLIVISASYVCRSQLIAYSYFCFICLQKSTHDDLKSVEQRLPLAAASLDSRGLYIYDDGFRFVIWFGRALSPDIAMNLLGPDCAAELSKV